ncbi:MAG: exopolysaccharide biosynthesis polyprenyl glycosylphosphotransferase [Methylovirgula sp.]
MFRADTPASQTIAQEAFSATKARKRRGPIRNRFFLIAALADICAIFASTVIASLLHHFAYRNLALDFHLQMCLLVSFLFVAISAMGDDYAIGQYLSAKDQFRRSFVPWCTAFATTLVVSLLVGSPNRLSLLPTPSLFLVGFAGVGVARQALAYRIQARAAQGRIAAKRLFLIGFESELESFTKGWEPHRFGMHIVAASVLRGPDSLAEDLTLARAYARILVPDDVFVLVPWSDKATIEATIDAFLGIPAAIHLGPEKVLERFADPRIAKIGPITCLNLVDHPLSPAALVVKRLFDLVLATAALIILAPLFLIVAIAIKCDSPGPIIFRQNRYGFNQEPFKIFKFRSMTTCEDNAQLVQVTSRTDARVTRVGAFLRSHNIDELPQLLNVILGQMSLVGPRPMAVVHDQMFERRIALYARRHNVKPGITGWAQINGCRGGLSEDKIRARIEHDLFYIDNWSLWFDINILWRTLTSKEAYIDAF